MVEPVRNLLSRHAVPVVPPALFDLPRCLGSHCPKSCPVSLPTKDHIVFAHGGETAVDPRSSRPSGAQAVKCTRGVEPCVTAGHRPPVPLGRAHGIQPGVQSQEGPLDAGWGFGGRQTLPCPHRLSTRLRSAIMGLGEEIESVRRSVGALRKHNRLPDGERRNKIQQAGNLAQRPQAVDEPQ